MQVKTFTYTKLIGGYYLQHWFSSEAMDTHIATMLADGWQVLNSASRPGDGRTFGSFVDHASITMTFKKG